MKKIAILGATGYIGKSLVFSLASKNKYDVFLFARSVKRLNNFLVGFDTRRNIKAFSFEKFNKYEYDVIINCVGIGDPKEMKEAGFELFKITEKFDNLILDYIKKRKKTIYINLSSGAVYGKSIEKPIEKSSFLILDINHIDQGDCYAVSKINCEAKHRALPDLNIVDIRIFSFFSRFIELKNSGFLISHIINSIRDEKTFFAVTEDFIRDFLNPNDLLNLIELIIKKKKINDFFDAYSLKPISFFELLEYFKKTKGLKFKFKNDLNLISPTGSKNVYYSKNRKAKTIGYYPQYSSIAGIKREIKYLLP